MAKKLSQLTTAEVKEQMSIAGSPEKITKLMEDILVLIGKTIDQTNAAEITNTEFALKRIQAEVKIMKNLYGTRTGQQI